MLSPKLFLVSLLECEWCTGGSDELIVALAVFLSNAPALAFLTCYVLTAQQADVVACIGTFSGVRVTAPIADWFESSVVSHSITFMVVLLGIP